MSNINTPMSIFQEICKSLRVDYTKRKQISVKYSTKDTQYFTDLLLELKTCSDKRKQEIENIFEKSQKQQQCSMNIEHLFALGSVEGKAKAERLLLENWRCTQRKSCPICAAIDGMKEIEKLLSYFRENPDVILFPFSISPKNYTGKTLRSAVRKAQRETEKIWEYFNDKTCKRAQSRGKGKAKLAIEQLRENMTGCFFSKEFEPGRTATEVNAHYHGVLFVRLHSSGSFKETLSYESFRAFIEAANGYKPCQVEIGNTKNRNRPITHEEDPMKALLETIRYIVKMPTKCEEDDFNSRQALIWEVSAATHRDNFIHKGGDLKGYKVPENDIELWTPEEIKHHELSYNSQDYDEHVKDYSDDFLCKFWRQKANIVHSESKLKVSEYNLKRAENELNEKRIKNLNSQIKRLKTIISKSQTFIDEHDLTNEINMMPKIEGLSFPWEEKKPIFEEPKTPEKEASSSRQKRGHLKHSFAGTCDWFAATNHNVFNQVCIERPKNDVKNGVKNKPPWSSTAGG